MNNQNIIKHTKRNVPSVLIIENIKLEEEAIAFVFPFFVFLYPIPMSYPFLIVKLIYPYLSKSIERIPHKIGNTLTKILVIIVVLDATISFTAIIRQSLRREGIKPFTFIGEICDKIYTEYRVDILCSSKILFL